MGAEGGPPLIRGKKLKTLLWRGVNGALADNARRTAMGARDNVV
jgi:hypothetical protein